MIQTAAKDKLTIPSDLDLAHQVLSRIAAHAEALGHSAGSCFALKLALTEALTNAICHGNRGERDKFVEVEFHVDEQLALITIEDEGPGFDPASLPDPTLPENLEKSHGRGVMLMRAYMSEVRFHGRGNRVTLIKHAR